MATLSPNEYRAINEYRRKRDFRHSPEPDGAAPAASSAALQTGHLYVMHKHAARRLHFDLRMEQDGVLRSWALPKGAPLESAEKRLAIEVENHPLEYGNFEGNIPKGEYGGGTVMLWDAGRWQPDGRNDADQLDFILTGAKLNVQKIFPTPAGQTRPPPCPHSLPPPLNVRRLAGPGCTRSSSTVIASWRTSSTAKFV